MSDTQCKRDERLFTRRTKCAMCERKINHLGIVCKCGKVYCLHHMLPENHSCQFDHKTFDRERLAKKMEVDL
jgi:alpha-galactosidase